MPAVIPYIAVVFVKGILGYDDALDTFGVHGVGGTLGAILTGVLATASERNRELATSRTSRSAASLAQQLKAIGSHHRPQSWSPRQSLPSSSKLVVGLRPTPEVETSGLDISEHGEEGYIL